MSLAITAAPWTNDNNTNSNVTRRRIPNMRRTLKQNRAYTKDDNISTSNNNDLYSSIDVYENDDGNGELSQRRNNATTEGGANIHEILNKINKFESMSSDGLADFNPPPKPELNQKKSIPIVGSLKDENMASSEGFESTSIPSFDVPIYIPRNSSSTTPSVSKISAANDLGLYANYKQSYEPPPRGLGYFATERTGGGNVTMEKLMEKINYVIHMLETQQHEKTNNVVEEVILYTFLGVFIIFVVDSFARAGKYTR